jgi:hypothetical protein
VVFTAAPVGSAPDADDVLAGVDVASTAAGVVFTAVGVLVDPAGTISVAVGVRLAVAVDVTLLVGVGWGVFVASASQDRLADLVSKLESTR